MTEEGANKTSWLVIVGGFLGAGKTTLIMAAARELERRGLRSAVIMNDQGRELVDTELARLSHVPSGEVVGGCFCCRLSDLLRVIEDLRAYSPDVMLAEPVGSCTDISATVLQPLLQDLGKVRIAPLTVLVDPVRAKALVAHDADANMQFLFQQQLKEADIVCFTKSDLFPEHPDLGATNVRQVSAHSGQGVAAWLDEVTSGEIAAGRVTLEIDYAQYARAEAALAWLNLRATFEPREWISPAMLLGPLLDGLDESLTAEGIPIVHLKGMVTASSGFLKAAICANGEEPVVEGNVDASPAGRLELLINLRAVGEPAHVRTTVEQEVQNLGLGLRDLAIDCFSPAAPVPGRRITHQRVAPAISNSPVAS
jgi:CobW/HypB/UreG, nucleotide-binding domain